MTTKTVLGFLSVAACLGGLSIGAQRSIAEGAATVCIALPKAQLGQGNNSPTDVSEPVRTALGTYMAGPAVQLVRLDARIAVQIEAEAAEKGCGYVLQSSVAQTKGGSAGGFFKKLAPFASALPMLGGMGGGGGMTGAIAAQAVASTAAQAAAESSAEDYMAAMTGAQQTNVKKGDTVTVEYALTEIGGAAAVKKDSLQSKASQDGEDVLGPLLEQVATAVVTAVAL